MATCHPVVYVTRYKTLEGLRVAQAWIFNTYEHRGMPPLYPTTPLLFQEGRVGVSTWGT